MTFLHWVVDDKFIDVLISIMEHTKGKHSHIYAIVTDHASDNLTYIQQKEYIRIIPSKDLIRVLTDCEVLVLHGLRIGVFDMLQQIPQRIKVIWSSWGYDLYSIPTKGYPFIKLPLYKPSTKRVMRKGFKEHLMGLHVEMNYFFNKKKIESAISRIDYFSSVIPQEYDLMRRLPFFKAQQVDLHYFSLDDIVSEENLGDPLPKGNNILIGNSGDPTNNHLDVFESLRNIDIGNCKIYVPLSYGGTIAYREKVKTVGKKYWGENFVALEKFVPYQEYNEIISSCSNIILFHERQQAMGNIRLGVWNGCKVFLSISGLTYQFHKNLGIRVFALQNELNAEELKTPLSAAEVNLNRRRMLDTISRKHLLNYIYHMYEILER